MLVKKGIDVSKYQGVIDFDAVKAAGYEFVIIRAGFGKEVSQKDPYFDINYKRAKVAGLYVGAYWYSYSKTVGGAKNEAKACRQILGDKTFELPIYIDIEEKEQLSKGPAFVANLIETFCSELESEGFFAGVYMSTSPMMQLPEMTLCRFALWVAQWGPACTMDKAKVGIWQHSNKGQVPGIVGNVDLNYMYIDYPTIIKNGKFNNFSDTYNLSLMERSIQNEQDLKILYECREKLEALKAKYM